jgi:hypothetical protein
MIFVDENYSSVLEQDLSVHVLQSEVPDEI